MNNLAVTDNKCSGTKEEKNTRVQAWVTPSFKQKVKDAVNKTHGETLENFVKRSLELMLETSEFPQVPNHLQSKVKRICTQADMSIEEFLTMSLEQAIAELEE